MDLVLNKLVKDKLKQKFITWYSDMVQEHVRSREETGDLEGACESFRPDLKLSTLKPVHARWLTDVLLDISREKDLIQKGWNMAMAKETDHASSSSKTETSSDPSVDTVEFTAEADAVPECCSATSPSVSATAASTTPLASPLTHSVPAAASSASPAPASPVSASPEPVKFVHEVWHVTKVHEWFLPSELCQSAIDGRSGSMACNIISAAMASKTLTNATFIPTCATSAPTTSVEPFVAAIRDGNRRHDESGQRGLLGIDDTLLISPDMKLQLAPNRDLGFFNRSHCEKRLPEFLKKVMVPESTTAAAVFVQTPYSIAVVFVKGRMVVFDSHAHGKRGALIAVAGDQLTPQLAAVYLANYMERHFALRTRVAGSQLCFVELV